MPLLVIFVVFQRQFVSSFTLSGNQNLPQQFMELFWPALRQNAMDKGPVYGVPFQNSTLLLYYNADAFKAAGLDPDHPPVTWQESADAARKLTRREGNQTKSWGLMMPNARVGHGDGAEAGRRAHEAVCGADRPEAARIGAPEPRSAPC